MPWDFIVLTDGFHTRYVFERNNFESSVRSMEHPPTNFGRSNMVAEAHMKKLREIHLEDARRVLTSMGCNYTSRLDNEDVIIMLMKKLPDESLKRMWVDMRFS